MLFRGAAEVDVEEFAFEAFAFDGGDFCVVEECDRSDDMKFDTVFPSVLNPERVDAVFFGLGGLAAARVVSGAGCATYTPFDHNGEGEAAAEDDVS